MRQGEMGEGRGLERGMERGGSRLISSAFWPARSLDGRDWRERRPTIGNRQALFRPTAWARTRLASHAQPPQIHHDAPSTKKPTG